VSDGVKGVGKLQRVGLVLLIVAVLPTAMQDLTALLAPLVPAMLVTVALVGVGVALNALRRRRGRQ
jgi:hypothetical protein